MVITCYHADVNATQSRFGCCSVDVTATTLYVRHHQLVGNASFPFNVYFVFPRAPSPIRLIPDLTIRVTRLPLVTTWGIKPRGVRVAHHFGFDSISAKTFKDSRICHNYWNASYMKCFLDLLYIHHCLWTKHGYFRQYWYLKQHTLLDLEKITDVKVSNKAL